MDVRHPDTPNSGMQAARLIIVVFAILVTVSYTSQWYAQEFSMPRYCAEPGRYIERVADMIKDGKMLENDNRRQYLVAAKLNYLAPRRPDEPLETYLKRLKTSIEETCR